MKEDEKLINAVIALAHEMKGMRRDMNTQLGDMNTQLGDMNTQLKGLNHRVDKLEKQQVKTNLLLAEHSRSIMALAEQQAETNIKLKDLRSDFNGLRSDFNGLRSDLKETNVKLDGLSSDFKKYANSNNLIISQHETRIIRLEDVTFNNNNKNISVIKEPKPIYKKKK